MRILVSALILGAVATGGAAAGNANAAADVHIMWMNCALHPGQLDIVYLENGGDVALDLAGWELRSDGAAETMSLTRAGAINPGEQIFVTAGIHAVDLPNERVYLWSNDEMLRDAGDPADYALLFDENGIQVSGMDCNHNLLAPPTTQPSTGPTPTAAPIPEPVVQIDPPSSISGGSPNPPRSTTLQPAPWPAEIPESVPLGGGPPGMGGGAAAGWIMTGAALATAGLAVTTLAARGRREPAAAPPEGSSRHA